MLKFMVVKDESEDLFYPTLFFGPAQIWIGKPHGEGEAAHEEGVSHITAVLSAVFDDADVALSFMTAADAVRSMDPEKIKHEALNRESMEGQDYTTAVLVIVAEALDGA